MLCDVPDTNRLRTHFWSHVFTYTPHSNVHLNLCNVTSCFRMHQESTEDGLLRRVQLDTALKALYTSSEGLSAEGDRVEGGARGDTMDIAEPSAHAQARIRYVIDVRLQLHHFFSVIFPAHLTHLDSTSLSFLCHMIISRSKMKGQSAKALGSTVMVSGKNTYKCICYSFKWSIWVVSWESPQTTLCIMKCHSRLSRAHVGGM